MYNEELADEANVNPFTVSRLLSDWQRKGILTKRRGKVLLRSPQRLFRERNKVCSFTVLRRSSATTATRHTYPSEEFPCPVRVSLRAVL